MARRPVFVPHAAPPWVRTLDLEFDWHPGFALSQAQKSIASLHRAAAAQGIDPVLEISSKSESPLGRQLSAFNLTITLPSGAVSTVEAAFQGSKVFSDGGPYTDLYVASSREAKQDARIRSGGRLVAFDYFGVQWPLEPKTLFYDWLYIRALLEHPALSMRLLSFGGFTDIAFNPDRSINCQARSAALFVALNRAGIDLDQVRSGEWFQQLLIPNQCGAVQGELFT
jgi:hypothetical protein